jgi:transcriptional regulator with XRE-family HTH domain
MRTPNVKSGHIGRKIERIRELRGIKQDTLASKLGISQQAVSKLEQSETIDAKKLKEIADALGVTADTIKNFNEDVVINNNNFNEQNQNNTVINYQFNPIDKLVEVFEENKKLYERLLESERKKNELLEAQLKGKK